MPASFFAAEYMCQYGETEGSVFRAEDIDAMLDPDAPLPIHRSYFS